ncbi:MAG: ATP-binding cassette domain-containing protein [candidate division Zixibacteria bacterium]|nr:ATP-binding cassette domain-containing protein [candidate division Zixibacteria bacterium]
MIELRNVNFAYDEKLVLINVDLQVEDGEALVIMGPSGSGKSTILRLLLGLECPQQGEVMIDGQNICTLREKDKRKIRKNIGMVFQNGALFDSLSVGENVGYYLFEHTRMSLDEISERVEKMLGFVGLDSEEIIDRLPEQLSGGMQRRVAIGRALLSTDPKIMLYDEPTTGLDPQSAATVLSLMQKLHDEKDICSVMVTHQIADALQFGNRFVVVIEGRVAFDGSLEELRESKAIDVLAFLAPFRESFYGVTKKKFV